MLCGIVLIVSVGWAGRGGASTLTFFDDVFISGNEKLEFSDFKLVGIDPHDISLEVLDDGLRISGLVDLSQFGFRAFQVSYKVTARDPGALVTGASLELESSTSPDGFSKVLAFESVLGKGGGHPEALLLKTFDFKDKWHDRFDEEAFHEARSSAYVWDKVLLFAPTSTSITLPSARSFAAAAPPTLSITNRFSVVPEPTTASLFALGFVVLYALERRRR